MKFLLFSLVAAFICLGGIEGCVPAGRRVKRAATQQDAFDKLRLDMKSCIDEKIENIGAAVDFYVEHSHWFERTDTVTCESDRTKECWQRALKEINPEYNNLHPVVSACIGRYADSVSRKRRQVRDEHSFKSRMIRNAVVSETGVEVFVNGSGSNQTVEIDPYTLVHCPTLTAYDFKTYVDMKEARLQIQLADDTTVSDIKDLAEVMINNIVCSKCTCEVIKANSGLTTFDKTGCEDCWYTRLAASTKSTSPLAKIFAEVAIEKEERTTIQCVPQTKIILDTKTLKQMDVTDLENEVYLGKHNICSDDPAATDVIDPKCKPTVKKNMAGEDIVVFDISAENCLDPSETKTEGGNLILTYHITKVPKIDQNLKVQRYTCYTKKMQCTVPQDVNLLYSQTGLTTSIKLINTTTVVGESEYKVDFQLTGQANVYAGEFVKATMNLNNVNDVDNYQLQTGSCWATSTPSAESGPKYQIMDCYGCPALDPQDENAVELTDTEDSKVEFKFKAFFWTGKPADEQKIYLHCELSICNKKAINTCNKIECDAKPATCPNAKRRRFRRGIDEVDKPEKDTVSIGPILVRPKREGTMMPHETFSVDV